jgi:hypothetical protein
MLPPLYSRSVVFTAPDAVTGYALEIASTSWSSRRMENLGVDGVVDISAMHLATVWPDIVMWHET